MGAVQDIAGKVRDVMERIMQPVAGSMLGFDERDLLAFAQQAGFVEVHLEYRAEIVPANASGDVTSADAPLIGRPLCIALPILSPPHSKRRCKWR